MSPTEWAGFFAGACAVLTSVFIGLRYLVKGWLNELKPNSGSSIKDQISRLETQSLQLQQRVDDLFVLISKR
jgi:hypothetical protein